MTRPSSVTSSPPREWWWIFDPRFSLRARITLWLGGASLLFTLLLIVAAGAALRRTHEAQLSSAFETLAFQVSDKIDRTLYERYRQLQFAAGLDALRQPQNASAENRTLLLALQSANPEFARISLIGPDGHVLVSTEPGFESATVSERPWFHGARERPFAGSVRDDTRLAQTAVNSDDEAPRFLDLAVPVTSLRGEFHGVLAAQVRWNWAREVQLSVVNDAAQREQLGVTIYAGPTDVLLDSGGTGWTEPPPAPAVPEARRFRGTMAERTAHGEHYLSGYARSRGFREYRGLGWLTVVRQPVERAFQPVDDLRRRIAGWGLVFACALMLASWLFAGRLARRMQAIATAADRIREGDVLTVLPLPHSNDEYGRMCGALGEMVDSLRGGGGYTSSKV